MSVSRTISDIFSVKE